MTIKMLLIFVNSEMGFYKNALSIHNYIKKKTKKNGNHKTFKIGLSIAQGYVPFSSHTKFQCIGKELVRLRKCSFCVLTQSGNYCLWPVIPAIHND